MAKQTGKVMWATRDAEDCVLSCKVFIWCFRAYPHKDPCGAWQSEDYSAWDGCVEGFTALTGITLTPGERIRVRLVTGWEKP